MILFDRFGQLETGFPFISWSGAHLSVTEATSGLFNPLIHKRIITTQVSRLSNAEGDDHYLLLKSTIDEGLIAIASGELRRVRLTLKYGLDGFFFLEGFEQFLFRPMRLDLSSFDSLLLRANYTDCAIGVMIHLYCFNRANNLFERVSQSLSLQISDEFLRFKLSHFKNHMVYADRQLLATVCGLKVEFSLERFPCQFALDSIHFE